jgi:hypothetical protein
MVRVGTAVAVDQAIIRRILAIIVGTLKRRLNRECRTWIPQNLGPENTLLLAPDRDPLATKNEAHVQSMSGDHPASCLTEALYVIENSQPQLQIEV